MEGQPDYAVQKSYQQQMNVKDNETCETANKHLYNIFTPQEYTFLLLNLLYHAETTVHPTPPPQDFRQSLWHVITFLAGGKV